VGFDDPRTLGTGEVGGHVAAPIFRDFMMAALKNVPAKPFPEAPSASAAVATNVLRGAPNTDDEQTASLFPPESETLTPPGVVRDGRQRAAPLPNDSAARPDQGQNPYWPPVPRAYSAPYPGTYGSTTYPSPYAPYRPDYSYAAPRDYGSASPYSYAPYSTPRGYGSPGGYPGYPTTSQRAYDTPGGYPPAQGGGYPAPGWRPGRGTGGLY
jgi:hypothetical protein